MEKGNNSEHAEFNSSIPPFTSVSIIISTIVGKCSGNSTNLVTFSSPSFQEHNICAATTLDSQL